ncbi:hypothetical protein AB0L40_05925 [Patulibacter sp. NPDC049589]|uniref:PIN-like domain-containing protein n=1 Tax=Patulibacter sp. NPDC049589 TaxID=3154731 RepID=UPI00344A2E8C
MITDLYVENGVGRRVTDAISIFTGSHGITAHFQHDVHPAMQIAQEGDEWWIEDAVARGWAILTQDKSILQQGPEREVLKAAGGTLFALSRADFPMWEKFRCFAVSWPAVSAMLAASGPQAMVLQKTGHEIRSL